MVSHTTIVTRKGQITIPVEVRRALRLEEGDQIEVEQHGDAVVLRRAESIAARTAGILAAYRHIPATNPAAERAAFEQAVAAEVASEG